MGRKHDWWKYGLEYVKGYQSFVMNICFSYTNFAGCVGRAFEAVDKAVCSDCGWGIPTYLIKQIEGDSMSHGIYPDHHILLIVCA